LAFKLGGRVFLFIGHSRNLIGQDGKPAALIWAMIDNYLIHAPTKKKCGEAFSEFKDYMVRLGFICQKVKTSPPKEVQKSCLMLLDTHYRCAYDQDN
jgi:hypothetical protein